MKKVIIVLMFLSIAALASISWDKPNVKTNTNNIAASYAERGFAPYIMHNGILKPTYDFVQQSDGSYNVIRIVDGTVYMRLPSGFNMNNLFTRGLCVTCTCTCCGCGFSTYQFNTQCVHCACNTAHKLHGPWTYWSCGCGMCYGVDCETLAPSN